MPLRPREIVVRAREAAALLLTKLDRDEMVPRFVECYATQYNRPGRAEQPGHYREQVETIRREAILAMVSRIEATLPGRLRIRTRNASSTRKTTRKGRTKAKGPRTPVQIAANPLLDLFREEFFVALGQALNWGKEEARGFWRDLDVYQKLAARATSGAKLFSETAACGPFAERVAILLDPSLMEEARRASAKFQVELNAASDSILKTVFSRRRTN